VTAAPRSPAIQPCVFDLDAKAALEGLATAFSFETRFPATDEAGRGERAEMFGLGAAIGLGCEWERPQFGGALMRGRASFDGVGAQPDRVRLSGEIHAHCACAAGAVITQEPEDQCGGDRICRERGLEGHVSNFSQTDKRLSVAEMARVRGLSFTSRV